MNLDFFETYGAAVAAVVGGIGVKIVDKLFNKRVEDRGEASLIRTELRTEITSLRAELDEWKTDADDWRSKYYEQVEENLKLLAEVEFLKSEIRTLKLEFEQFSNGSKPKE